jgi:CBS domain-containing protein
MDTIAREPTIEKTARTRADPKTSLLDPEIGVSWILNREVISVRPDLSLNSLESLLVGQDLSRVPVVDEDGLLVGVVSKTDLVAHHYDQGDTEETPVPVPGRRRDPPPPVGFHTHVEDPMTVSDLMCQTVLTVTPETTIAHAAELMAVHRVHGLPVVEKRKVIGWVSTLDILSWVAGLTW